MPATRLSARVIARLIEAEACEPNPHYVDDLRIARLTVAYAASGEAVLCTPHVLASYMVLGLHPERVWPAICARREALRGRESDAPPKKPAQSVKLWFEKNERRERVNSRGAMQQGSPRTTISVPMAAPSIAALYPNSDAPSSAKKREFSYRELLLLVQYSGAPGSVKAGTISALLARGPWPKEDGPATSEICVSLLGMMLDGTCCKRTAQRRVKRACDLGFWRRTRNLNSWLPCPKCNAERTSAKCSSCGHKGSSRNLREFRRPFTYEIDVEKFRSAPRPREIRHFDARTYAEYKAAARRGEHPNVTEMPARKSPGQEPPKSPAIAVKQAAAEHAHRNPARPQPKLSKTEAAKFVSDMAQAMRGHTRHVEAVGGLAYDLDPTDPRYRAPVSQKDAILAVCERWRRAPDAVIEALKFWGYSLQQEE